MKALAGVDRFRGTAQFKVWFTRIAINEALMFLRRHKKDTRVVSLEQDAEGETVFELPSHSPSPEALARTKEAWGVVTSEVRRMPPVLREEFRWMFLGVGTGTNNARKTRKFRVRERLQRALTERGMGING